MKYQGQHVLVTTLKNSDLVALGKVIDSLNKEVIKIFYSASHMLDHNIEYSAIVITKV